MRIALLTAMLCLAGCATRELKLPNGASYKTTTVLLTSKVAGFDYNMTGPDTGHLKVGTVDTDQTPIMRATALLEAASKLK